MNETGMNDVLAFLRTRLLLQPDRLSQIAGELAPANEQVMRGGVGAGLLRTRALIGVYDELRRIRMILEQSDESPTAPTEGLDI